MNYNFKNENTKNEFIQLPELPADLDAKVVSLLWTIAQMPEESRETLLEDLEEMVEVIDPAKKTEILNEDGTAEAALKTLTDEAVKPFYRMLRDVIGQVMKESCVLASWVYLEHVVKVRSADELKQENPQSAEYIELVAKMFNRE